MDLPHLQVVLGAKCNITDNALDRHLTNGNKNKAAFIFLGEDGSERVYTYGRLAQSVNRFANGLKSLGVKRVTVWSFTCHYHQKVPSPC
ncbi:MAG: hypothetical protein Ct9H300mP11_31200 [Chloroflexota bacterium]|nr:MAG: hypothetical protein Ct9H300mP11_31200 [Chloroflexota bacterium]